MNEERRRATDELWEEKFKGVRDKIDGLRELIEIKLDAIIIQTTATNGSVTNHEGRINSLEKWRVYIIGGASGIIFLGGIIAWIIK